MNGQKTVSDMTIKTGKADYLPTGKLRGDLRVIEVFAKLTLVSGLMEAWQSPTETSVDVTSHSTASERVREEVLRALRDFRYRKEQGKLETLTNGTCVKTHPSTKSFV